MSDFFVLLTLDLLSYIIDSSFYLVLSVAQKVRNIKRQKLEYTTTD